MVAIATLPRTLTRPAAAAPDRRLPVAGRSGRPRLALVPAPTRGRSLVGLVAGALLALAVVVAGAYLIRTPTVSPGSSGATHVVAEGETMWSIAVAHAPAGEAATYVERLVDANGTAAVAAGQQVTLPAP